MVCLTSRKKAIEALNAPDMTHAMLAAINKISKGLVSQAISPEQAIGELTTISPNLGSLLQRAFAIAKPAGYFFGVAIAVSSAIISYQQVNVATESLRLQREESISSEAVAKQTLETLSETEEEAERKVDDCGKQTAGDATENVPAARSGPFKLPHHHIQQNRRILDNCIGAVSILV